MKTGLVVLQHGAHFSQHAAFFHVAQTSQQLFFGNPDFRRDKAVRRRRKRHSLLHPPDNLSVDAIYHKTPTLLEIRHSL